MALNVDLIRPNDLLNLHVSCVNVQLDAADPASPALVVADAEWPAYLVIQFPPHDTNMTHWVGTIRLATEPAPGQHPASTDY